MILFGGYGDTWLNDVWTLPLEPLGNWTRLVTTGTPPSPRLLTALAYDPVRDRVLLFGGLSELFVRGDTWELSLSGAPTWTQLASAGPLPRYGHLAFYEPAGDRFFVLFGRNTSSLGDVWSFSLAPGGGWSLVVPAGDSPGSRHYSAGVFSPPLASYFIFGGEQGVPVADTWMLSLSPTPAWSLVRDVGNPPPAITLHTAVYDFLRQRMIVFGGWNSSTGGGHTGAYGLDLSAALAPVITELVPPAGRIGDALEIRGLLLQEVTTVTFAPGVTAPIENQSATSIQVHVPSGARTGQIVVSGPTGSFASVGSFFVGEAPVVEGIEPDSGRIADEIRIRGRHLTGATRVRFGAASYAAIVPVSDSALIAIVDSAAASGPVTVDNPIGSGTSPQPFRFIPPNPSAIIVSVRDVPRDQGGHVAVKWRRSDYDIPNRRGIARYRLWRRAPLDAVTARSAMPLAPAPPGFWEPIAEVPAIRIPGYAVTASTPSDSSALGNPYTAFFVETVTDTAGVFYLSPVDSGYSVDDLAPPGPSPFAVVYLPTRNELHWGASRAADFHSFRLYRATRVDFSPDDTQLVLEGRDTTCTDVSGGWFYKLVAVDVHGNRSRPAVVFPDMPVAALATLIERSAAADRVTLRWYAPGFEGHAFRVERREAFGAWALLSTVNADGSGFVSLDDRAVTPGAEYGYRLVFMDGDEQHQTAEIRIAVPGLATRIERITPNPARASEMEAVLRLTGVGECSLEMLDVTGRRWAGERYAAGTAGRRTWRLPTGANLPAGLYLIRLRERGFEQTARVVILE